MTGFMEGVDVEILFSGGFASKGRVLSGFSGHPPNSVQLMGVVPHRPSHRVQTTKLLHRQTEVQCFGGPFEASYEQIGVHDQITAGLHKSRESAVGVLLKPSRHPAPTSAA